MAMVVTMVVTMVVSPVVVMVMVVMATLCYGLSDHDPSCHAQSCSNAGSSLEHNSVRGTRM